MSRRSPFSSTSFMINDILRSQAQDKFMQESEELHNIRANHPLLLLARNPYAASNLIGSNPVRLGLPSLGDPNNLRTSTCIDDPHSYFKNGLSFMSPQARYIPPRASDLMNANCVFPPFISPSSMNPYLPLYLRNRFLNFAEAAGHGARKCRRSRTVFSELQLMALEERFKQQKYLSTPDRMELAEGLGLTQLQVKTWYQNRRMKWKKQVQQKETGKQTNCDSSGCDESNSVNDRQQRCKFEPIHRDCVSDYEDGQVVNSCSRNLPGTSTSQSIVFCPESSKPSIDSRSRGHQFPKGPAIKHHHAIVT